MHSVGHFTHLQRLWIHRWWDIQPHPCWQQYSAPSQESQMLWSWSLLLPGLHQLLQPGWIYFCHNCSHQRYLQFWCQNHQVCQLKFQNSFNGHHFSYIMQILVSWFRPLMFASWTGGWETHGSSHACWSVQPGTRWRVHPGPRRASPRRPP